MSISARKRCKGSEIVEFTLTFIPVLAMLCVLIDTGWAIFAESTLQRAVRLGVRTGVTLTAADMTGGACLTETVKGVVQQNAMGLLNGSSGLALIKVHYLQPPAPNSSSAATDVSTQASGNSSGNIMEVSVQGYSLAPLLPRIFWKQNPDKAPLTISVSSADLIEPSRTPPCCGRSTG